MGMTVEALLDTACLRSNGLLFNANRMDANFFPQGERRNRATRKMTYSSTYAANSFFLFKSRAAQALGRANCNKSKYALVMHFVMIWMALFRFLT